jgi:hypothetical protein
MDAKERIQEHIKQQGLEKAFTAKDLVSVAARGTIDVTLSRLVKAGAIRRIGRGLYDSPRHSELLGQAVPPDIDQAAQAIARKHRWTITPDGATAANMLGLSQQVPAKIIYLSDGPTRQISVGRRKISFRHASPKDLKMPHYSSRLITQALRFLGKENVAPGVIERLRNNISQEDKERFLEDARYGTGWIYDVAKRLKEN